ncbi:MAG: Asp-tRNA(Asn)/Glu-tRNA(Gln) amidotransferase GatCAB subunit B, partial [Planctomycetes bacterium]|nr:Asp-tRNA(Asn)/Glu-tRNA(Gln) amidotransferase GatCAB subunit B [Planctomycetota bacterium]
LMGSVMRQLKDSGARIADLAARVPPQGLCELIAAVQDGTLAPNTAKEVFQEMAATGKGATALIAERGLRQISDSGELEAVVLRILTENPKAVADLRQGKKQALGFLMGQVMKATGGKANPKAVAGLIGRMLPKAP